MMKKGLLLITVIIFICSLMQAQNPVNDTHKKVVNRFFEAYNQQNFKEIRSTYNWLLKLVFTKKKVKNLYTFQYNAFGKARIKNIKSLSKSAVSAEVMYDADTTETEVYNFNFTKKNKVIGFGSRSAKLKYKKSAASTSSAGLMKQRIDSLVQVKHKSGGFNGCVLVINNNDILYKRCAGYADYESKTLLNDSSVFELASCSKQFTAFAIMMLEEQGKLSYTDDITKYIPELPYKNVTVEQLLTHTSGLPDYMEMLDKHWDKTKFVTNNDMVTCFKKYKPKTVFKPGKKYEYSNTGYALLSVIIEKVSGTTYKEFLSKNIFQPLGMRNSRVYNTRRSAGETIKNYAFGHVYSSAQKKFLLPDSLAEYNYVKYMDAITGDGTVNSTINDLALWDKALRENKLVKKSTLERAFSKARLSSGEVVEYGYGWEIMEENDFEKIVYHSGSWPGYLTFIMRFAEKDKTVIILSNNEYMNIMKFAKKLGDIINN